MKNKGFTTIELLVVILIIGVVFSAASVGVFHILNIKKEKEDKLYKEKLEAAACLLVDLSEYKESHITIEGKTLEECREEKLCNIRVSYLVNNGLLSKKDEYDETQIVSVTWADGLKECHVKE